MSSPNRFADYGRIVAADRFVGREPELTVIAERVTGPENPGCLALVGEPRIGKSNLAWHGVMTRREEFAKRKVVPIWLAVNTFRSGWLFFAGLVDRVSRALEQRDWLDPKALRLSQAIAQANSLDERAQADVVAFFEVVAARGFRIIAVLDEFDHARNLWSENNAGLQLLRDLAYNPESSLTLVTVSRRELGDIEMRCGLCSTFDGIFRAEFVTPFSHAASVSYFERAASLGADFSPDEREYVEAYTGGHPMFLDVFCFEASRSARAEQGPRRSAVDFAEAVEQHLVPLHAKVVELMRDEGSLSRLLQVLFGPVFDVRQTDVNRFLRYGVIREVGDGYGSFCESFREHLRGIAHDVDVWPLWRETEVAIRTMVRTFLVEQYGQDWPRGLRAARPKLATSIDQWETARAKDVRRLGPRASCELLDYTYPGDLFAIIQSNWAWFSRPFVGPMPEWEHRFRVLASVRTPLAHNRAAGLVGGTVEEATGICRQILERLRAWEAKGRADGQ